MSFTVLDPYTAFLARKVGIWDVTETIVATPGAEPVVHDYLATREMIGPFLRETIRPKRPADGTAFQRMYLLGYQALEGRWKYVSLDTRNPVGLMPASSFDGGSDGRIELRFDPFAIPGPDGGPPLLLRMEESLQTIDDDLDTAEERFLIADGSAQLWAAYTYNYNRRS